jgi:hypothetical protein
MGRRMGCSTHTNTRARVLLRGWDAVYISIKILEACKVKTKEEA